MFGPFLCHRVCQVARIAVVGLIAFTVAGPVLSQSIELSGGTTVLPATAPTATADALGHYGFHSNSDAYLNLDNNGGLMQLQAHPNFNAQVLLTDGPGSRGLDFDSDADFTGSGAVAQTDNYQNLWIGTITVAAGEGGNWTFRNGGNDDRSSIWIDLDQDGFFESSTLGLGSNRGEQLAWEDTGSKTVTLVAGEKYLVAFGHTEYSGASSVDYRYRSPSMSAEAVIKPSAQSGVWSFTPLTTTSADPINVNASSTLDLSSLVSSSSLTFTADGLTLTSASSNGASGVQAGSLTITGATTLNGTTTFDTQTASVTLSGVVQDGGASSSLVKTGDRTLYLTGANTYTGQTTISGGIVKLGNNAALGDEVGKTVINGGTLDVNGFRAGVNGNELIEVQGTGANGQGAIVNTGGSKTDALRRVTLTGDATFNSGSRFDIRNSGGDATFDMNGFTLTKTGGSELCLVSTAVVNPGDVNVNQGIFRIEGATDFDGGRTITLAGGATLDFYSNTQTHDVNVSLANGANLTSSGIGNGPILPGNVTLTGNANVGGGIPITIDGLVAGAYTLTRTGSGVLTLTNPANSVSRIDIAGGTVRVTNETALGGTTFLTLNTGDTIDFAGNLAFNTGTTLAQLNAQGGTIANSAAGTTTIVDIPITMSATDRVGFGGAGNLDIMQGFGNGSAPKLFDGMVEKIFDAQNPSATATNPRNDIQSYIDAPIGANDAQGILTGHLHYYDDAAVNARADALGAPGFDPENSPGSEDWSAVWYTQFTPNESGQWEFQHGGADDNWGFWIDTTGVTGQFDATSDRFADGAYMSTGSGAKATPALTAGTTYLLAFGIQDTGGGGNLRDIEFRSPSGVFTDLNPTVNPGLFQTPVQPDNDVIKTGAGTTTLYGANTFNGSVTVEQGTLVAANDAAFGVAGGDIIAHSRTTIGFRQTTGGTDVTITGENITGLDGAAAGQGGSLINVNGNNTFAGNIAASTTPLDYSLGVYSAAGSLTLGTTGGGSTLDTQFSRLTFDGAGDVVVNSAITGKSAAEAVATFHGYLFDGNDTDLPGDSSQVAEKFGSGQVWFAQEADSVNFWGTDLYGRGNVGSPNDPNNWAATYIADLTIDGTGTASVLFRHTSADDANHIRIDANRNGVFESGATEDPYGGDQGGTYTTSAITLDCGVPIPVALQTREGSGGSRFQPEVSLDGGTTWQRLDTAGMTGATLTTTFSPVNRLIKQGTGATTLAGDNSAYSADYVVKQGTLIAAHDNALGGTTGTTRVTGSGTLGLQGGITTPAAEVITIQGQGHGAAGALRNISESNTIGGNVEFAPSAADVKMASDAGALTIQGNVDMRASNLTVAGAGDMVIEGALFTSDPTVTVGTAGLLETVYNVNDSDNPTAGTAVAGPTAYLSVRAGETTSAQPWNYVVNNETIVYQGQFYDDDGKFAFAENIDDEVRIFVDGVLVLANDTWNVPTTTASTTNNTAAGAGVLDFGMGPESDGWHNIEFRFANGSGGAGPATGSGWTSTYGFGLNDEPAPSFTSINGDDYFAPVDPGNATLFRHNLTEYTAQNSLTKTGAGTLTLGGDNTYAGTTDVEEGVLWVNGSHTGGGAYTVHSGATLGGTGSIGSAVAVNAGGTLSPGMSPGVLAMQSLALAADSTTLMEINGLVRDTEYDGVDIIAEDGLAYGGALAIDFGNSTWLDAGAVFDLFNYSGTASGAFSDVVSTGFYTGEWLWDGVDTFSLESGWQTLLFSHATGDLTIVPEPAAWTLLLCALACGLLSRRRR